MPLFYLSFAVALASSVLYHLFQKSIAPEVNPVISLLVTYLTAIVLCLPLFALFPLGDGLAEALRRVNWASFALAAAIVGLELGFLLAYRAGWNISVTGVAVNAAAAVVLLPVGLAFFRERPSLINVIGVFVSIVGLVMVGWRR